MNMRIIVMFLFSFTFIQNVKAEPELKAGALVPNSPAVSAQPSVADVNMDPSAKMVYIINKGPFNFVKPTDDSDKSKHDAVEPQRVSRFKYDGHLGVKINAKVYSRKWYLGLYGWPFSTRLSEISQDFKGGSYLWIFEDGKEPIMTQDMSILYKLMKK